MERVAGLCTRYMVEESAAAMQLLSLQHTRSMTYAVQGHTGRYHNFIKVLFTCKSAQLHPGCCTLPPSSSSSLLCAFTLNRACCQLNGSSTGSPDAADCCRATRVSPELPEGSSVQPSGCCGASAAVALPQLCTRGSCSSCSPLLTARRLWTTSRACRNIHTWSLDCRKLGC
jgi:hypothetical protein